ncbi:ankyrin repeat domain-containing protein [Sphingobacterium hungaricum]|uniref:Ankyrin repeat domain-containing protein n=1 Tax=Sphingobacterium hungaricum TaxID=2082723 RepID=A0A928URQ2_9SPHI|nr:ankyrin repeat domain-containing protein [Sphingobacterium hungaricum]MBE8712081.1 hypothetical protein [Sphingobacterium hungaricum]
MKFIFLSILTFALSSTCAQSNQTAMDSEKLIQAVETGDIAEIQQLVTKENVNTINAKKQSLLMIATYKDNFQAARLLVSLGADVNQQDDLLNSPFLYAGASGYLEFVQLFLENGADFNVFNRYNGSALIPAAEKGHVETVRLLANTADYPVNHVNRLGWTALMEAVVLSDGGKKHQEIVQILLDAGADKSIPDKEGVTALTHAKNRGFTEIAEILEK